MKYSLAIFTIICLLVLPLLDARANAQTAMHFVDQMSSEGLGLLSNGSLSKEQKKAHFKKLLQNNFDMNTISRFAVGRYWRQMTPAQQQEYRSLFENMLVNVYADRFDDYQGEKLEVTDAIVLSDKDTLVKSRIVSASGNGTPVEVDWRVRFRDGRYRVIDVIVAGVSMSVTQRSDFSSLIQRGGGNVDILLAHLKK